MNHQTVSVKTVFQKVIRDFNLGDEFNEGDAIEWAGEALQLIGHHSGFQTKVATLQVKNYRTPFPCDFYSFRPEGISYEGRKLPYHEDATILDGDDRPRDVYTGRGEFYTNNLDYINTSFQEGEIKLYYKALPIDKEGYPLIPKNMEYQRAISWYIFSMLILGGLERAGFNWETANQKWEFYKLNAQNDAAYPTVDQVEAFGRSWVRLIPQIGNPQTFYTGNNFEENIIL